MILGLISWQSTVTGRSSVRRGEGNYGSIDGERITDEEFHGAYADTCLRYFFAHTEWPNRGAKKADFDEDRETYQRLFLIRKLKEYDIQVDNDLVAKVAANFLRSFERDGHVTPNDFVQRVLPSQRFTAEDFEGYIRHELGIQQLFSVVGLSGKLVLLPEVQSLYEREREDLSTEAVFFSGSNYLASVPAPTPEALAQFYTNQMSAYRVPDRMQVSYVVFNVTNYLAAAEKKTNWTDQAEAVLRQLGTNYVRFGKTPDEAKTNILDRMVRQEALREASQKANTFANQLFDKKPVQPENLAALAKEQGLAVKVTAPFDEENGPAELAAGPNFTKTAFSLSPDDNPFADEPQICEDGVYVIAYDKKYPSEIPPLDKIRERVTAEYRYSQAVLLARQAGTSFVQTLTNGLAQGKSFSAICVDAKVKLILVPPFSLSTRELPEVEDHIHLNQFKQIAFTTPPGKVSAFSSTLEGGAVVYVQQRLPIDREKMRADMPAFLDSIRQQRARDAINDWFSKEASKSLRDTPLGQPRQSALTSGQAKH
jgi:hypothetical protein